LGINSIAANSPQAKGRVERLWKTFQDRLTSELRLAGANSRETANQVLKSFLPEYNQRFKVSPEKQGQLTENPKQILSRTNISATNTRVPSDPIMWYVL